MLLTKEQILSQKLASERVPIPWLKDSEVIVRALTSSVIAKSQSLTLETSHEAFVFVNALIDEDGNRLYSDDDAKTIENTIDRSLIDFVWSKAWGLSVIPDGRREEIKKNLPKTLADVLYGESPSPSDTPTPT